MGNLNDYGLPQMKRILGDTGLTKDSVYLGYLHQAVDDVAAVTKDGRSVAVTGSSYVVSTDPGSTSPLWNVYATRGVYLLRKKEYEDFLNQMEGLSSIRDDVATMSRTTTMRFKFEMVKEAKREYAKALFAYTKSGAYSFQETGLRENLVGETDQATDA